MMLRALVVGHLGGLLAGAWRDVSVAEYGAVPDSGELCTEAFQRALADVGSAGGGTVRVPAGSYLTGPLNLTSNLVLWLERGAHVQADTEVRRLPQLPPLPSWGPRDAPQQWLAAMRPQADLRDALPRYQALLYGDSVRNVTITGENGTLDGNGVVWWRRWLSEPILARPHVVQFTRSRDVRIRNVTLVNPGFWSVHVWMCEYVTVQFLTVLVLPWRPSVRPTNTDGVNPDSSSHVLIEDSYFQTGDDAIAIKSGWDCFGREMNVPSRNVTVRRVQVRQTEGCNAAGIAVGSEMSGGIEDVLIEDCHFLNAGVAVEVKTSASRGGYVRRVLARNLTVESTLRGALVVMATYPEPSPFCRGKPSPPPPLITTVGFEAVRVLGPTRGHLVQLKGTQDVFLHNISVRQVTGSGDWACAHVDGQAEQNVPPACRKLQPPTSAQGQLGAREGEVEVPLDPAAAEDGRGEPLGGTVDEYAPRELPSAAARVEGGREPAGMVLLWRNDGRCGPAFPGDDGFGRCPTPEEYRAEAGKPWRASAEEWLRHAPCCSSSGWCGDQEVHCYCEGCVDYRRLPFRQYAPAQESPQHEPVVEYQYAPRAYYQMPAGQRPAPRVQWAARQQERRHFRASRPYTGAPFRGQSTEPTSVEDAVAGGGLGAALSMYCMVCSCSGTAWLCAVLLRCCFPELQKPCSYYRILMFGVLLVTFTHTLFFAGQHLSVSGEQPQESGAGVAAAGSSPGRIWSEPGAIPGPGGYASPGTALSAAEPAAEPEAEAEAAPPEADALSGADAGSSSASLREPGAASGGGETLGSDCELGPWVRPPDFGAVGDGETDDSQAVLEALQYGARCKAGVAIGPRHKRFLVMPRAIQLALSDVTVRFESFLLGPALQAWNPRFERWPSGSCAYGEWGCSSAGKHSPEFVRSQWSLLTIRGGSNVTLEGPGGLHAPGWSFWTVRNMQPQVRGYCLLKLDGCTGVRVSGLKLSDSPMYQVVVMGSKDVSLQKLKITVRDSRLGEQGPHNTDGVSIIASQDVYLSESEIESGDDNVVIKEGSRRVLGERLVLRRGKGISIGSLGERGAEDQVVTDVTFRDVSLTQSVHGARIKTWQDARGLVRNVSFSGFNVRQVDVGILIDQMYCPLSQRPEGCSGRGEEAINIKDVTFRGFTGTVTRQEKAITCVKCENVQTLDLRMERIYESYSYRSG